jgi:hypothetical protein
MSTSSRSGEGAAFAKHAQQDTALAEARGDEDDASQASPPTAKGLTTLGRLLVFLLFPFVVGLLGLYLAYLETLSKPDRTISWDLDFVTPFLLALAMAVVLGVQTGGFTSKKVKPIVQWPKVKRVKRVVKKKANSSEQTAHKKDD